MNLCSGFLSIVFIFYRNLEAAALLILIGAIFDFLDGFSAKMLDAISPVGKVLDSLADIVTFGLAPAAIMYRLVELSLAHTTPEFDFYTASITARIFLFSSVIILIASAIRLAEFSVRKESDQFYGMPTPATGLFISGLAIMASDPETTPLASIVINIYFLLCTILILSLFMVSKIRFISLKFKNFHIRQHAIQYIFLGISVIMLIVFKKFAISLIILVYIFISIVNHFIAKSPDQ